MRRCLLVLALCFFAALPASAAITGIVMTTAGQPVAGAKVDIYSLKPLDEVRARLLSDKPEPVPIGSAASDAKGRFTLESPSDPVVVVRVTAPGFAPLGRSIERDEDLGAVALTAAETKSGRITAEGKAVAGAHVIFNNGEVIATTDAQGRYTASDPAKWGGMIVVVHPDYAMAETNTFRPMATGRGAVLDQTLNSGVTLPGTVVGRDGKTPVAGAVISIDGWPLATSAQDGTFVIRHAPAKWESVTARSGELVGLRARGANATSVVIKLDKGASVTGSIRDTKTKAPVAGAQIRVAVTRSLGMMAAEASTGLTDAKGNFAIAGVAPGSYQLMISRPGYSVASLSVALKAGEKVNKLLVATPDARVSGVVVDEQKRPVVAARISASGSSGGVPFDLQTMFTGRGDAGAVSAPDGTFALRVAPERETRVHALRTGYPPASSSSFRLAPGERKSGVVLTVPNGVSITGRVLDKDGKPVDGVDVVPAESEAFAGNMMQRVVRGVQRHDEEVTTSADGTFSVRVKEGTYDLVFRRDGYATKLMRAVHVTGSPRPLEVTLEPAVEISGRVVRNGAGVAGVRVTAIGETAGETAETGVDGSFVISNLSPGQVMLNAGKADEYIQIMRPVTAPAHDVTIEVPPGSRVSGRVVDKETKQPIAAFDLGLGMSRGGGGMMFSFVPNMRHFTSDDGTFVLENVPAGQTQIVVNAPGYTTARVPNVDVQEGKGASDVEIAMDHGVRVAGHVTGPDGSALGAVSVRVTTGSAGRLIGPGMNNSMTVTDANGDYAIEAVEPGDKTIVFASSGYQPLQKSASLSGNETRVDAQLSTGTQVSGTVVTDTGEPVADAEVSASSAAQAAGYRGTRTDANGNFTLENLASGRYTFRASKTGYSSGVVNDFDIAAGGPVRITLKTGGVVYGHVSGLTADELQSANVQASGANGGASAPVDASGNYRIEGAPTGTVRVSARTTTGIAGGRTSPVQSVQVDSGAPAQVDIAFNSDTVISGRVTRNGVPVEGALVAFMPKEAQAQTSARTTTTNGGQYQVTGLDDATYNISVVDIQRSAPFSTTYQVHGSGNFDIDMKGVSLRGRVVDASGNPVSAAVVEIHEKADGGGMRLLNQTVQSDPSGAFRLDNVQPDSYTIVASKEGYGTKSIDASVTESSPEIQIALQQNAGVALRVVDARNGQALMARVHVTDMNDQTIYDSPFMSAGSDLIKLPLEPGQYRVQIMAMNYAPQAVTITSPSSPTIGLTPGGTIAVQSKATGLRRARLLGPDGKPYVGRAFFTVDPAPGVTILNNIAAGTYTVQILGDDNEVVATAPVTVIDGQTVSVRL